MIMSAQAAFVPTFLKASRRSSHGLVGAILLLLCYLGSIEVLVRVYPSEPSVFEQIA